ncbi:hypothetical protein ABH922_002779 [Rhodococcus sp. 27YEA15]|uniref:hypothetical protein n=1 Tax=Rhodococcus sp. 27YEA15 TaxID=3156259 RepID=UPI003C7B14F0
MNADVTAAVLQVGIAIAAILVGYAIALRFRRTRAQGGATAAPAWSKEPVAWDIEVDHSADIERAVVQRNAMGILVHAPTYDNGSLIPKQTRNYLHAIHVARLREAQKRSTPNGDDPWIDPHTFAWLEAKRILGRRAQRIRADSIRQISGRYLKADQFILDADGKPKLTANGLDFATESVRIRIPRDSWLRKNFKHPKR